MVHVEGQRIIRTPIQKVFQLVSRLDAHPRVTGLWLTVDLLERRPNTLTVHYRGYLAGIPIESVQQATLQPPQRIEFRQTRGGFKTFRGAYALKSVDGDTELSLSIEAELGIQFISEAATGHVLQAYVEHTLNKFKLTAERELPRVGRRPQEKPLPSAPPPTAEPTPAPIIAPPVAAPSQPGPPHKRRRRRRRRRHPAGPRKGVNEAAGPARGPQGGGPHR